MMDLQVDLIRVELQVHHIESWRYRAPHTGCFNCCHYYSNHALSYLRKQEYSTTDVVMVKSIRQVLGLYDTASQDGFNPDIRFIKRI